MAAINYYVSIPFRQLPQGGTDNAHMHSGTSSSSSDFIELRMQVQTGADVATGLTKRDVIMAMEVFERWIIEGGLTGNGTNVPYAAS